MQVYSLSKSVIKLPSSMASILEHLIAAHNVTDFPLWPSKIQLFCLQFASMLQVQQNIPL
jgi:hypothetical protein